MPQGLIDHNGGGTGEIEGANVVGEDGDAQDGVCVGGQQIVWESFGFAAKDEGVAGLVFGLSIEAGASGAVEEQPGGLNRIEACLPGGMNLHVNGVPVVQTRAAELGIGYGEPQRLDKVETRAGGRAKPCNITRVGGNFRTNQNHVEGNGRPSEGKISLAGVGMFHEGEDRR